MRATLETVLIFTVMVLAISSCVYLLSACGTTNHKRRFLQQMNPGCEVTERLEITCPTPN